MTPVEDGLVEHIGGLGKFGYIPNGGLFEDDITPQDGRIITQKYDRELAEFSAHAWTNERHIYNQRVLAKPMVSPMEISDSVNGPSRGNRHRGLGTAAFRSRGGGIRKSPPP